jgi:ABC-2 type transport system ATP-binding protein
MSNASSHIAPVLQFQNTIKDYGSKKIGPVDLDIGKGEIMGFLGPNGSGKTTCIRLMLGLIRPTSGNVRVNGYDPISKHIQALKHVAYSPELPNIQTFLTPTELLTLVLHELGFRDDKQKEIRRVLELVGLIEYQDTKVGKLSKGMVQRLSVAQALIGNPELLILDEPMLGLDPAGSAHFREVFREFAMEGKGTVFMSSHMMNEVESLCTSVSIIHNGRILFRGSSSEVIRRVLDYSVVTVEAGGLKQETINSIKELPSVSQVSINNQTVEIIIKGHDEIRPTVSDLIVKSGAKLYTIKTANNMLERAYIQALKTTGSDR